MLQLHAGRIAARGIVQRRIRRRCEPGRSQAVHGDLGRRQHGEIGSAGAGHEIGGPRLVDLADGAASARACLDVSRGGEGHQEPAREAPRRDRRAGPPQARELTTHTTGPHALRRKLKDDRDKSPKRHPFAPLRDGESRPYERDSVDSRLTGRAVARFCSRFGRFWRISRRKIAVFRSGRSLKDQCARRTSSRDSAAPSAPRKQFPAIADGRDPRHLRAE